MLGTGTSVGVPALGCSCHVCVENRLLNRRSRCSVILGLPEGNLLIDTAPDMRMQLLREGIGIVHAVAYTHEHSDHVMGFDDLRMFQHYLGGPVPIYCRKIVADRLRMAFDYAFADVKQTHAGAVPAVTMHLIEDQQFDVLGTTVIPIPMLHGPRFKVLGFRIGNVAYCTDINAIPPASWSLLTGLDTLIIDALRPAPHPTHFTIDEAIAVAQQLCPGQTYFTHCSCSLDYYEVNPKLPPNIHVGYDGLRIRLT